MRVKVSISWILDAFQLEHSSGILKEFALVYKHSDKMT